MQQIPGWFQEDVTLGIFLSPDARHLAVLTHGGALTIHAVEGDRLGKVVRHSRHGGSGPSVSWSPSGDLMAHVTPDGAVELNNLRIGGTSTLEVGRARIAALSPNQQRLAVIAEHLNGRRLDLIPLHQRYGSDSYPVGGPGWSETSVQQYNPTVGDCLAWSPDGRLLAWTQGGNTIFLWNVRTSSLMQKLDGHHNAVTGLAWDAGNTLLSASLDGTVRRWPGAWPSAPQVLEGDGPFLGLAPLGGNTTLAWTDVEFLCWSDIYGSISQRRRYSSDGSRSLTSAPVSATPQGELLALLTNQSKPVIEFSRELVGSDGPAEAVRTYSNAKILLLGDTGVGKSGLGHVLAGEAYRATESTHARKVWTLPVDGGGVDREVMLWDLAGQPGYRIVHQLHLDDAAAAMVLYDSRSETAPLAGIGYWARALRHANPDGSLPTFLVAARSDRGGITLSDDRLRGVMDTFGFAHHAETSAKEGLGVAELRDALLAAIDWSRIPVTTSTALFAAAKRFVLEQKATGALLTPISALQSAFLTAPVDPAGRTGRDLMGSDEGAAVFEGCVGRLGAAGLVKRLAFGDLVLLQPELLDVYAGAVVNAARAEPDGLGSMLESRVIDAEFPLPGDERIKDPQQERLLLIAMIEELTRHEIVLREHTEQGVQLVFPSAFRRDLPEGDIPGATAEFSFEGPVATVYATLVVRLSRSTRFARRDLWRSAARFEADVGGLCSVRLVADDEGRGRLDVAYDAGVGEVVQVQFERFIAGHLERRAIAGTVARRRVYQCPDCGTAFSAEQIALALGRNRQDVRCPVDEKLVPLTDPYAGPSQRAETEQMDASADAARTRAANDSIILGKKETTDFDVFLCHHTKDEQVVRWLADRLRDRAVLPWLYQDEVAPGRVWQEELQRQITDIRSVAVLLGPGGLSSWQSREVRAFIEQFDERGSPVIPVLLPGASPADLPVFLREFAWVDLGARDDAAVERLVWGIRGTRQ